MDKEIASYVDNCNALGIPVNYNNLKTRGKLIGDQHNINNLNYLNGWVEEMKKRLNMRGGRFYGEGCCVDSAVIEVFRSVEVPRILTFEMMIRYLIVMKHRCFGN